MSAPAGRIPSWAAAGAAVPLLAATVHTLPVVTGIDVVRRRMFPALAGIGRGDHVALTFDDGPDPASTPRFLDELDRLDVLATFFVLGRMLAEHPELGRELASRGHEVGVHGWAHRNHLRRTAPAISTDLRRTRDLVADLTGAMPRFFRPPYGVLSAGSLLAARRLGLQPVLWTAWGRDWEQRATPDRVLATVRRGLAGGGTVLLHDSDCTSAPGAWRSALDAVPTIVELCRAQGLGVGPVREHGLPTNLATPTP